jgi:hypothetical protein
MRKIGNQLATPLFALLCAASLAFGVGSVFAQPAAVSACPVDYPNGYVGLACSVNSDCAQECQYVYPGVSNAWNCAGGCCLCAV